MGKDFNQILESGNEQEFVPLGKPADPNLVTTPAIQERISERHIKFQAAQFYAQSFLSFLTAPLITTHVSLQLSVIPHKNLYGDTVEQDLKALAKVSKEITVQDRRKFELLIKSGATGTNRPFRAPVYGTYMEVFRGLSNQGLLGFYKGNFVGLMYTFCNSTLRFNSIDMLDYSQYSFYHQGNSLLRGFSMFLICSAIDIMCQPLQTIQSRFILQNRLPNFALYKSFLDVFKRHKRQPFELYKGALGHSIKNAVLAFTWSLYDKDNAKQSFLISTLASHFLTYPVLTAIRRVQCQSNLPGMIPKRYGGTFHALRLIAQEEGVKGLYRGFIAYALAQTFLNGFVFLSNSFINSAIQE
ncbi:carrier protein (macronuclear) [Tetrahymena thermophila SB210]|uniref:Carrier protein n=1 Tax=Tetrahymena thermophila (strain SB210) TaxID=312017 RepID=Q231I0_TETTS|nr:carrier protein [Tetrahymena thermophila SB210]EAR91059.1 carrier protein [Tetrahymena thermophila SB210]|eukprot:XP_001011304.1 carrier protein [Tetrahymena thermophila SB210]